MYIHINHYKQNDQLHVADDLRGEEAGRAYLVIPY